MEKAKKLTEPTGKEVIVHNPTVQYNCHQYDPMKSAFHKITRGGEDEKLAGYTGTDTGTAIKGRGLKGRK